MDKGRIGIDRLVLEAGERGKTRLLGVEIIFGEEFFMP
jgi:hypothetical protein